MKTWGEPTKFVAEKPEGDKKDKKDKKEPVVGGKNAKVDAKAERLKKRQAEAAAKEENKKDPNDPSAH